MACRKVANRIECEKCGYPFSEARYPDDVDNPLPCNATDEEIKQHMAVNAFIVDEVKMDSRLNIVPLVRLADKGLASELAEYGSFSPDIQEALKQEMEEEKKKAAQTAAKEIIKLVKTADNRIEQNVLNIRRLRKKEKELKKEMEAISDAKAIGMKSSNFVPLALAVGVPSKIIEDMVDTETFKKLSTLK